tara:strand:+ start:10017 stop:10991 length:975 start_codon:yes stop_codon:yes gene_type:complete
MAVGRKIKPYQHSSPLRGKRAELRKQQRDAMDNLNTMQGQFSDLGTDNLYAGAENMFAGAKNTFAGAKNAYAGAQNQFSNLENTAEDLTVNQQQAGFEREQAQGSQANILDALSSGGSFNAGNIQALANAGSQQARSASVSLGQQESRNQAIAAQQAGSNQMASAQGQQSADMARMGGAANQQQMMMQGAQNQQQMIMGGAANQQQMQLQGEQSARELEYQKVQGQMSLQAGLLEGARASEDSRRSWFAKTFTSSRKLKENISLIGKSPSGINIYKFEYKDKSMGDGVYQGVMADEVSKDVVVKHPDGYDMVNYNKIDVEFIKI